MGNRTYGSKIISDPAVAIRGLQWGYWPVPVLLIFILVFLITLTACSDSASTPAPETAVTPTPEIIAATPAPPANTPEPTATTAHTPNIHSTPTPRVLSPTPTEDRGAVLSSLSDAELACVGGDPEKMIAALTGGGPASTDEQARLIGCLDDDTVQQLFMATIIPVPLSVETSNCVLAALDVIDPRAVMTAGLECDPGTAMAGSMTAFIVTLSCLNQDEWQTTAPKVGMDLDEQEGMVCVLEELGGPAEMAAAMIAANEGDAMALSTAAMECGLDTGPAPGQAATEPTETPAAKPNIADSTTGEPTPQDLNDLLNLVPSGFADDIIMFSFNAPESQDEHGQFPEGRAMHPEIAANIVKLNELMDLDFQSYEQGIWSWKPGNRSRTFMAFQGPVAGQQTRDKLEGLGFRETSYRDTAYFELHEDFKFDIKHGLRRTGLLFNRLALIENSVLAAPATEIIENLIAAQQTDSQTPSTSSPHSALAKAVGNGMVSGAFFGPEWIAETWNTVNPGPSDRLDRYLAGPEAWGTLSGYSLALLGYRVTGSGDEMVVALYYPESVDVEAHSKELASRWNSYVYDPSGPLAEADEMPLNQACSPLSVHTIQNADHSIIVGSCPMVDNEDTGSGIIGLSIWLWLFDTRQLEFLAPDIEDLR